MTTRLKRLPLPSGDAPPLSLAAFRALMAAEPSGCEAWVDVTGLDKVSRDDPTIRPVYELADPVAERDEPTLCAVVDWSAAARLNRKVRGNADRAIIGYEGPLRLRANGDAVEIVDISPDRVARFIEVLAREARRIASCLGVTGGQSGLEESDRADVVDVLHCPDDPCWPDVQSRLQQLASASSVEWRPVAINLTGGRGIRAVSA